MEYKIITDEEGLLQEKESWNALCDSMPWASPFQTWQWNYIWWKNNEPADSLFVIKAYMGKQVFGYAPLIVKEKTASFIGGQDMDYGMFVVVHNAVAVIEGFLQILQEKGFALALQEMPSRAPQLHIVQKLLEDRKRYLVHKTTRAAYVQTMLHSSFDAYCMLLSRNMRNRTIKVGLKRNFAIQIDAATPELFREIQSVFENRQEARGGDNDLRWAFPVIEQMCQEGLMHIYTARDEGKMVGFLVMMLYKNRQYSWLQAFHEEYASAHPGQILVYQMLKDAFEQGHDAVDFMRGDYDFKMRWECELDTNYTVCVYNSTLSYWKNKLYHAVKPAAKRFLKNHPKIERMCRRNGA